MSSVKNSQSEARDFCVQPMREERNCGYPGSRSSRFCVNSKDTDCGYRYQAIKVMGIHNPTQFPALFKFNSYFYKTYSFPTLFKPFILVAKIWKVWFKSFEKNYESNRYSRTILKYWSFSFNFNSFQPKQFLLLKSYL